MLNVKVYIPAEMKYITVESEDILTTSNYEPTPDNASGNGPVDDPYKDIDW
ncbi:MAG: hypothetical protein J6A90_00700 [Clostridia bacterium]|nr:hypothetical protein [Clostridia bacterium]